MEQATFQARVAAVRHFTRFYARQVGHLQEGLLDSRFSLTEAHVLYELANRERPTAKEIGHTLGLDPGYLSRILRRFRELKLVTRTRSGRDGRERLLALTARGREAFAPIDRRSNEQVEEVLKKLSETDQDRFIEAVRTVETLVRTPASRSPRYLLRSHRPGDMGWIVSRHGALYAEEHGWDERLEALVAEIVASFLETFDPQRERCWIAEIDGRRVGSVFLAAKSRSVARLRLLLVEPEARGLGIGRRLVEECVAFARSARYASITLSTYSVLTPARAIYRKAGFRPVRKRNQKAYGHDLVDETWTLKL